jgi:hypothetical protein
MDHRLGEPLPGRPVAAVRTGRKVRYFTAADLAYTLYRGLAENSVGKVIDTLRNDRLLVDEVGFAPRDDTGAQLLFRFVSAAYERSALGIASHWPFDQWGRFCPSTPPPQPPRPAAPPRKRSGHQRRLLPHTPSPSQRTNHPENN